MNEEPAPTIDPAHDLLGSDRSSLHTFFAPRSIALIGATERPGSVGRTLLHNLLNGRLRDHVYPVNPHRSQVLGMESFPSVAAIPSPVDLAVIATPAHTVPTIIGECADAGVQRAIIISAGFKEVGAEGALVEQEILRQARRAKLRIIGPNCLGIMRPASGLNASLADAIPRAGSVALVSQSGALGAAILGWSIRENVGFSAFVSVGSMLDVDLGDLIDYFGDDPHTESIVIYMESIGAAQGFLSAAREVALSKPIIVIKGGRSQQAARAATSHTGVLTGSDEVLAAAFRRCGVLRVNTIAELFYMAEVLEKQPRPKGPRLTILSNAGGPGVLATDALIGRGGELAALSPTTEEALHALLPAHWSHGNPIDILGDASAERYARAAQIAINDPNSDGLLMIFAPQGIADAQAVAEQVLPNAKGHSKPVLASWMGGPEVEAGIHVFNQANIPTFPYPDTAARVFYDMWRYSYNLRGIYQTPALPKDGDEGAPDSDTVAQILGDARHRGRTLLTEVESKRILAAYGMPVVETRVAADETAAVAEAEMIGYPVVLKVLSETITHKSNVGGVQLNLANATAVRRAYREIEASVIQQAGEGHFLGVSVQRMLASNGYELIIGSSIDAQFGPVILFGSGGQMVELFDDRALALPPLNSTLARRLMEQTRVFKALEGDRGRSPVDLQGLEQLMVRFSRLVIEQPRLREIDINPLLVSSEGFVALDARMVLHGAEIQDDQLPQPVIRPYPSHYVTPWTMKDGTPVMIRPIRAEDEPLMVKFHQTLSESSVYTRYFHMIKLDQRIAHERLTRICFIDYRREMALVVVRRDSETGELQIAGVGRLSKLHGTRDAEFALLISDRYQGKGLGGELLRRLVGIGRDERLRRIVADILPENRGMQRICRQLGFRLRHDRDEGVVKAELTLDMAEAA